MRFKKKLKDRTISITYFLDKRSNSKISDGKRSIPEYIKEFVFGSKKGEILYALTIKVNAFDKAYIMRSLYFRFNPSYYPSLNSPHDSGMGYQDSYISEFHFNENSFLEYCAKREFEVVFNLISFLFDLYGEEFSFNKFSDLYEFASRSFIIETEKIGLYVLRGGYEVAYREAIKEKPDIYYIGDILNWNARFLRLYDFLDSYLKNEEFGSSKVLFDEDLAVIKELFYLAKILFNYDVSITNMDFIMKNFSTDDLEKLDESLKVIYEKEIKYVTSRLLSIK